MMLSFSPIPLYLFPLGIPCTEGAHCRLCWIKKSKVELSDTLPDSRVGKYLISSKTADKKLIKFL